MSVRVRTGGGQQTLKGIAVRTGGGLQSIKKGRIRDGGGILRIFWQLITLVLSENSSGERFAVVSTPNFGAKVVTINHVVTVVTGVAPFTYAWSFVGGDPDVACSNAAIANPNFSITLVPGEQAYATYKCVVSDATGASAEAYVQFNFEVVYTGEQP